MTVTPTSSTATAHFSHRTAAEKPTCALLSLPGGKSPHYNDRVRKLTGGCAEIRNRIYDFAAEDGLDALKKKRESTYGSEYVSNYVRDAGRQHRQYKSLAQVCRLIRTEFLPLYSARNIFAVDLEDLYEYVELKDELPGVAEEQVLGNIIVPGFSFFTAQSSADISVDLKPLIRLINKARHLHVSWHSSDHDNPEDETPIMNALLRLRDTPLLRDYVDEALTTIELRSTVYRVAGIWLEVKQEYWELWMACWVDEYPERSYSEDPYTGGELKEKARDWADAVQLPLLGSESANCLHFVQSAY